MDDNLLKLDTVNPDYIRFVDRPAKGYDVEHQIEVFASFCGHVIIQSLFLTGTWRGRDVDNTGNAYVMPWLNALRRIGPRSVADKVGTGDNADQFFLLHNRKQALALTKNDFNNSVQVAT